MLTLSPLINTKDEREGEMESFSIGGDDFTFSGENLFDSIDFDDLFVGINDEDVLPDLEMDPEILAEFSVSGGEESEMRGKDNSRKDEEDKVSTGSGFNSGSSLIQGEEVAVNPSMKKTDKGRKSSAQSKNSKGNRKMKVDWTPELHRRFVQAVEHLGVDKAVPSRILELMGIDCLTRHNIASHLQKYRSHRKHLLAREAEAARWSHRRQIHGAAAGGGGGGGSKRVMSTWLAPTMGFPPMTTMNHFRPLHVWGHPSMDQSLIHMWPKHLAHSPSPPPPPPPPPMWVPAPPPNLPPPPVDPSFWSFPPPPPRTRFPTPPVPGIPPPHAMRKLNPGIRVPTAQTCPRPPFDFHPSKESIDAAIGDALSKPWLPLPLGLKPPSIDSVVVELQHQGISKIPTT